MGDEASASGGRDSCSVSISAAVRCTRGEDTAAGLMLSSNRPVGLRVAPVGVCLGLRVVGRPSSGASGTPERCARGEDGAAGLILSSDGSCDKAGGFGLYSVSLVVSAVGCEDTNPCVGFLLSNVDSDGQRAANILAAVICVLAAVISVIAAISSNRSCSNSTDTVDIRGGRRRKDGDDSGGSRRSGDSRAIDCTWLGGVSAKMWRSSGVEGLEGIVSSDIGDLGAVKTCVRGGCQSRDEGDRELADELHVDVYCLCAL